MKVCVITDEISSDPKVAVDLASGWGIRHFEIRRIWDRRVPDIEDFQVEQLKKILTEYGVDVAALSPGIFKINIEDAENIERHLTETLPRSIDLGKVLGTNLIIIFGFVGEKSKYEMYFDLMVDTLREAADYAAKKGFLLALENEPICLADTGERTAKLVKAVRRNNLFVNWDPCNAYRAGERPFPDGYEHVKDLLLHVHLKDCIIDNEAVEEKYVPFNEGEVRLFDQIRALKSNSYKGFISIETHLKPKVEGTLKCWTALRKFLEEIGEKVE
jgi:sugar phosphate isomerase/epimerase